MIRLNTPTLKSVRSALPLVCASLLMMLAPSAQAQGGSDLPRSTVEAISVSGSQRTQINEFVEVWTARALSDDAQSAKKAMEALTEPLNQRGVSVAFRQTYTQAIASLLGEFDAIDSVGSTLAALRLAGDLATPSAASRIQSAIKSSDDLGVQVFAVARAGQVFDVTIKHGPAMTAGDARSLIEAIESIASGASSDDLNPELLRSCVRALSIATRLSSRDMGDTRSLAVNALANIVGPHLRSLGINDDPSFAQDLALQAASAMTTSISDISSDTTPDAVKSAVGLGGDIISVALRQVLKNTIAPVDDRELTTRSVQAGETLLYFALRNDAELDNNYGQTVRQTAFAEQLAAGDDKAFRNAASLLLGARSAICSGFGFDDNRFVR
ncbi:MAG: hypothetical protein JKX70_00280 [Phycisphaerales bacterium]|nr:hypothetical protein [Phycisphaerales bacterium]